MTSMVSTWYAVAVAFGSFHNFTVNSTFLVRPSSKTIQA